MTYKLNWEIWLYGCILAFIMGFVTGGYLAQ